VNEVFLISEQIDLYRWLTVVEDECDWGVKVAVIREKAVSRGFGPVPVVWAPETKSRPLCDFPNFRPNLLCLSRRAREVLGSLLTPVGVWIDLYGVPERYVGFHCSFFADAIDGSLIDESLLASGLGSIHSPGFPPPLRRAAIPKSHAFRVSQSITKMFVSEQFKELYESYNLSGLEFIPVSLT
jgi:hypothetical protein